MAIIAFYKFEDNINDYSGNGNNGTAYNSQYIQGVENKSILFPSAKTGYVNLGSTIGNFTTQDFTFMFMYKLYSYTSYSNGNPIVISNGLFGSRGYFSEMTATEIHFSTHQQGFWQYSGAEYSFSLNTWYHICLTRQGSSVRIYVNGVDKTGIAASHINPASSTYPLCLNRHDSNGTNNNGYVAFDAFKMFDNKLSGANVKNEYARIKGFF